MRVAGLLELGGDVAAAQIEVETSELAGRLQRAVDLLGALAIVSAIRLDVSMIVGSPASG